MFEIFLTGANQHIYTYNYFFSFSLFISIPGPSINVSLWQSGVWMPGTKINLFTSPTGKSVILFAEEELMLAPSGKTLVFEIHELPYSNGLIVCTLLNRMQFQPNIFPINHEAYLNLTEDKC